MQFLTTSAKSKFYESSWDESAFSLACFKSCKSQLLLCFWKSFFNFSYTYMRVRWTFFIQVDLTFAIVYRHLLQSFKACCAFRLVRLNIKAKIHITNIIIENDFLRRAAQNKSYIQKIIIIIFTFINSCCFSISFWR